MAIPCGIDVGYSKTAAVFPGKQSMFPSISKPAEMWTASCPAGQDTNGKGFLLSYNGRTVSVGEPCPEGQGVSSWRAPRREDTRWYESEMYRDLVLAACSEATAKVYAELFVVIGIPLASFRAGDANRVRAVFEGDHQLTRSDRGHNQTFRVRVARVISQPFGAAFSRILDDRGAVVDLELARSRFGVIDAGGESSQAFTVERLRAVPGRVGSLDRGGCDILQSVRARLAEVAPDLQVSDSRLARAVLGAARASPAAWISYRGELLDLSPIAGELLDDFARRIVSLAAGLWDRGADLSRILLCGGAASMIAGRVKKTFPHAVLVDRPQLATAVGYARYATYLANRPALPVRYEPAYSITQ